MVKKRYFLRYFIKTPNSIGNRKEIENGKISAWKFVFGNNEISLIDHIDGLFSDLLVEANSMEEAERKSKVFVENILNLIDFSTSSASSSAVLVNIYDASPNKLPRREYKQIFYLPLKERNIFPLNEKAFGEIFYCFNNFNDKKIIRAISWLRKGHLEENCIDKFIAFWTGLEVINELLADKFNVPLDERKMKCKKDDGSFQEIPITVGIRKLFEEIKEKKLFKEIRQTRGKLLHGGGSLDDNFVNKIKEYNPIVRKALVFGIGILQIDDKIIEQIISQRSKRYTEKLKVIVKSHLIDFTPPRLEEVGKQPRLDLVDRDLLKRYVKSDEELNLQERIIFKCINAKFEGFTIELWGEEDTSIVNAQIINVK